MVVEVEPVFPFALFVDVEVVVRVAVSGGEEPLAAHVEGVVRVAGGLLAQAEGQADVVVPLAAQLHLPVEEQGRQFLVVEAQPQVDGIGRRVAHQGLDGGGIAGFHASGAVHIIIR